ncbi:MAG: hypothetical protein QOJ07_3260 [Thermoleophilaceae bacterium]|jgi:hypothetical protein|nr:hypothetical protein [Thermoleophilaceae bacterium]
MDPIHPIDLTDDSVKRIDRIRTARVQREMPDQPREKREQARREGHDDPGETAPVIVHADESGDGHPHCDIRV